MKRWILVAALMLGVTGVASMQGCCAHWDKDKAEIADVKVKIEDCPKAVQETIKKEVGNGKIEDITKDAEDGKTSYEADVEIGGKDYEIKVAEDGTLISKKLEKADEGDKKDEKDEKGQHEDKK